MPTALQGAIATLAKPETGTIFFVEWFSKLRGFAPYSWQTTLFQAILAGYPPELIYIPTGGGKTDIITIWLLAVLHQIQQTKITTIPRRLYFAVDRRTVVDQTEELAAELLVAVNKESELSDLLNSKTTSQKPLIVSVLRGQRVTEQEPLIADPSAFGIVLCTPDMALSRLLFSAYGCSPRVASREAGLVGHDSWIVLDEAHISDAGRNALKFVSQYNQGLKNFWYTCMTATPRNGDVANKLVLGDDDLEMMKTILHAHKSIKVQETEEDVVTAVQNAIEEHTSQFDWKRLIVYVEKPQDAARICRILDKEYNVTLLTGTMRGHERSKLDFDAFKKKVSYTETKKDVLVCTSAGELGLDVSCDFMITEFTHLERLLQRLGRLNRWAESALGYGYILRVTEDAETKKKKAEKEAKKSKKKQEKTQAKQMTLKATLDYLQSLPTHDGWTDVSGYTLYLNPASEAAFSPTPQSFVLNEAILAQLVNTSVDHGISVESHIRGLNVEYHLNFVIRKKQELAALVTMTPEELENYVAAVPVMNGEIFKEPISSKLTADLVKLLGSRDALFVSARGEPERLTADQIGSSKREGMLYLPDDIQCIDECGMFKVGGEGAGDVFTQVQSQYRRFIRMGDSFECIDTGIMIDASSLQKLLKIVDVPEGFTAKVIFNAANLVYVKIAKKHRHSTMTVKDHAAMAGETAADMVAALQLPVDLIPSLMDAALHHDDGKRHLLWQRALRGVVKEGSEPLAKAKYFQCPKLLCGMRHELVSALDNPDLGALVLWLILSHHGRCRPFFPVKSYDPNRLEESAALNAKLPPLFEQLNAKFGYWGLAYLEAIIRGIDIQSEKQ